MRTARDWAIECNNYLGKRVGTYEFRCRRYNKVYEAMQRIGIPDDATVIDVGAGRGEFGLYLREQRPDSRHLYVPIDGSIDGIELENWEPHHEVDFFVAIEFLEHLKAPGWLLRCMCAHAKRGVIITTPNAACTDVLGMDPTHKTPLSMEELMAWGLTVSPQMLFTEDRLDTLIGVWQRAKTLQKL